MNKASVPILCDPATEKEVRYRRSIAKKANGFCLCGDLQEIEAYSDEFLSCIDAFVSENGAAQLPNGKPIVGYGSLRKDHFYFVSSLFHKEHDFKRLSDLGLIYGRDFIWAPEWEGNDKIPAYRSATWEEKEPTYDFSKKEGPWDYRYRILLEHLPRNCRSVMDCGAGNMSLSHMLKDEIAYYPVDYKQNNPSTIVCDFNRGEFPRLKVDATFLCGILEYIENPNRFLKNICKRCGMVLMTYNVLSEKITMQQRRLLGWKSHLTTGDIVSIFEENRFRLVRELYTDAPETYLIFEKSGNCFERLFI